MSSVRLSLACPGATAAEMLVLAKRAQRFNLGVWLGDPAACAPNSDDSYVLATAGALAMATQDTRIGIWLTLRGSAALIRIAEDLGVIDQMSGGRLNLGLVAPVNSDPNWAVQVKRLMAAWRAWPLPDGRVVAASPPPAQPRIPTTLLGSAALAADLGLAKGVVAAANEPTPDVADFLVYAPSMEGLGLSGWIVDFERRLNDLRALVAAHRNVAEVMLVLSEPHLEEAEFKRLGMALGPALRATAGDRDCLARDAWAWATEKEAFHQFSDMER